MFDRRAAGELAAAKPRDEAGDVAAADVYVPGEDGEAIDWRRGRLNRERLDEDRTDRFAPAREFVAIAARLRLDPPDDGVSRHDLAARVNGRLIGDGFGARRAARAGAGENKCGKRKRAPDGPAQRRASDAGG